LILLARQTLQKVPGAKIIFDVPCSQALIEDIEAHGGIPIMWKSGHSFIKAKRTEEKAPLAGEKSGHVFFGPPEYYGFDDGCFTALKLLEYISNQQKSFSEIISETPFYVISPTIHVPCPDEVKYQVLEKLVEEFKKDFKDSKVIDIDGARVIFDDGWGVVRASSNLPVLVLRFEAKSEKRLKEIENIFRERLAKYPEISRDWRNG
jgi:phosphomannomutase/phosphoglucomutase